MVLMQTRSRIYCVLRRSACALIRCENNDRHVLLQRIMPISDNRRFVYTTGRMLETAKKKTKALALFAFDHVNEKDKETFIDVLHMYESQEPLRKGHVDFINAAMNYMDEFGVNEDLEIYKKLIDIMPKGKFISRSPMAADFMHYPKQQQCIIDLLEKMENNGVIGDGEMELMLLNIFGKYGIPLRKFWRMMYWMPKFRNLNPWPTPRPVPNDSLILAKIAIEKIASVDAQSEVTVFDTDTVSDSIDKTWIVSANSPDQRSLLKKHRENVACYVEGPYKIWVAHMPVDYFILKADPSDRPKDPGIDEDDVTKIDIMFFDTPKNILATMRSVHEQEDATIYSVCATGTSSKDSLLSWIRCLQRTNPVLEKIPVLFKLTKHIDTPEEIEAGATDESVDAIKPVQKISEN